MLAALAIALACSDKGETPLPPADAHDSGNGSGNDSGGDETPRCSDAPYVTVESGFSAGCAVHSDGCMDCWSGPVDTDSRWTEAGFTDPPEGPIVAVSVSKGCLGDPECGIEGPECWPEPAACALLEDGTVTCWGEPALVPPLGQQLTQVDVGLHHACGLTPDGLAVCWGEACDHGECDPPETPFIDLVSGQGFSCGLTVEGTVSCWGASPDVNCACAERETCWSEREEYFLPWQEGPYQRLLASANVLCGVQDTTLSCVDYYNFISAEQPVSTTLPADTSDLFYMWGVIFVAYACGIDADGTMICESLEDRPDFTPGFADERIVNVSAGDGVCAVTEEGRLICAYTHERLAWCPYCDEVWYP